MPKIRQKLSTRRGKKSARARRGTATRFFAAVAGRLFSMLRTTPLGLLLLAGLAFYRQDILPANLVAALPAISLITLVFSLVITAWFNRGRAFFILLVLLLSQWGMAAFAPAHVGKAFALQGLYTFLSLLLPLNILGFSLLAEGKIFSAWGRRCLMLIGLQAAMVLGMVWSGDRVFFNEIGRQSAQLPFLSATPLSDSAVIAFAVSGILLLLGRRRVNRHFRLGVLAVLAVVGLAHHFYPDPLAIPLFYASAGLIMILSVLQEYYFKAYFDELTGLPSRRSLNEEMLQLEGVYVIAMLDVDFFKKFNDTYGHDAGDDVLRMIASVMMDFKAGEAFRYGGEEFTVLFPGKSLSEALPLLEQLRTAIAKRKFVVRGGKKREQRLTVTVSIGAAESNAKLSSHKAVLKAADQALYRAKENGRNCVSQ